MLTGQTVVLRALERDDVRVVHALANELETEALASASAPRPVPLARLEARFDERARTGDDPVLRFVVEVDGGSVGACELHSLDQRNGTAHVGIALLQAHWGKGYGGDAVATLVDYAFRHLNLRKVSLEVLADDERAVRAYRRAGFVEEGRLRAESWYDGDYRDVLRMAVLRP